jgi:hypothetical protein
LNGNCSAQTLIAADYATNSIYAAGWSAGQNGGYGFGAWSMDNTTGSLVQNAMDRTNSPYASSFDPFGVAWTIFNPNGPISPAYPGLGQPAGWPGGCASPPDTGVIGPGNPPHGDVSRAGRAIPNGGLQVGQTFSTIIANPTDRGFYRGYTVVLSSGSDNIQYGNFGMRLAVGCFEYFSYGRWQAGLGPGTVSLYDTNTTAGVEIDVTMTDTNSYHLVMTPLNNPGIAYTEDGSFSTKTTNGPINWITYQFYNTDSDFYNVDTNANITYPTNAPCGPNPTDFYIKSMTISGPAPLMLNIQLVGTNVVLSWPTNGSGLNLASSLNIGSGAAWSTNLPAPVVINGQNVVTNPLANTRQFYRLQQ